MAYLDVDQFELIFGRQSWRESRKTYTKKFGSRVEKFEDPHCVL